MAEDRFEKSDSVFKEFKEANTDASFAKYYMKSALETVKQGAGHATLGKNLNKFPNWWDAGAKPFAKYQRLFPIKEDSKVVDYGCGSLRIGGHFIRYLKPESFMGLDVNSGFYEMGKELIGEKMVDEKAPRFAEISEEAVKQAVAFNADIVYSSAVCYHVHPDEAETYFSNLSRITHKKGAVLFFDATVSDEHFRYRHRSWSWPLDFYLKSLPSLRLARIHKSKDREEEGHKFMVGILEFHKE